ncbi:Inositol 2-dehydrogenase/D-chiro-inositol 3-dehydrogenase [subsurface metagenome]
MSNKMNRRTFLKGGSGVVLGSVGFPYLVASSAPGKAGTVSPSNRIVMGCIGVGPQGTGNMRAFLRIPGVQVVAVCDVEKGSDLYYGGQVAGLNPARRVVKEYYAGESPTGDYGGCDVYGDFRQLLERDDIDAVTVCTPDHWHGLISVAAAEAGKDIYCEKPLVNTIAEGRAVCDAVEKQGRILQTGSHERSNDSVRFAAELVRNGYIGKLHTIRVNMPNSDPHHRKILTMTEAQPVMEVPKSLDYDMWLGPTPEMPYTKYRSHFWWRFILTYGGGEMTDRGAHIIDLAQLGNDADDSGPIELEGRGKSPASGIFDAFMQYDFECKYANGVRLIGSSRAPRGLKFEGSDGWIFIHIHGGRLEAQPESLLQQSIAPGELHLGRSPGHHQNFIDSVKARKQPVASAEIGHRTATICHLLNIAMLTEKKLVWDPVKEEITNDAEANSMLSRPMRSPWHL